MKQGRYLHGLMKEAKLNPTMSEAEIAALMGQMGPRPAWAVRALGVAVGHARALSPPPSARVCTAGRCAEGRSPHGRLFLFLEYF